MKQNSFTTASRSFVLPTHALVRDSSRTLLKNIERLHSPSLELSGRYSSLVRAASAWGIGPAEDIHAGGDMFLHSAE